MGWHLSWKATSNYPVLHAVWDIMRQKVRRPVAASSGLALNLGISQTALTLLSAVWAVGDVLFTFQITHGHL